MKNRPVYVLLPLLWMASFKETCCGQQPTSQAAVLHETFGNYVIPDVDDKLSLASLLRNDSVANALGLEQKSIQVVNEYLSKNRGSFSTKVFTFSGENPPIAELRASHEAFRNESAIFLDELISPHQWSKLKQLAYQTEAQRIGLGEALTNGRLGHDIGVYEQQVEAIKRRATEVEKSVSQKIQLILAEGQNTILSELTPDQRRAAESLLGVPFVLREGSPFVLQEISSNKEPTTQKVGHPK